MPLLVVLRIQGIKMRASRLASHHAPAARTYWTLYPYLPIRHIFPIATQTAVQPITIMNHKHQDIIWISKKILKVEPSQDLPPHPTTVIRSIECFRSVAWENWTRIRYTDEAYTVSTSSSYPGFPYPSRKSLCIANWFHKDIWFTYEQGRKESNENNNNHLTVGSLTEYLIISA